MTVEGAAPGVGTSEVARGAGTGRRRRVDARPVLRASSEPRKFTEDVRERYLVALRVGQGRYAAARTAGVGAETVRRYARASEEFRVACVEAEWEALEPVEDRLREAALDGQPWAVKMVLERRLGERWGPPAERVDVSVSGDVGVSVSVEGGSAGVDRALGGMLEALDARRREVLDVTGVERELDAGES